MTEPTDRSVFEQSSNTDEMRAAILSGVFSVGEALLLHEEKAETTSTLVVLDPSQYPELPDEVIPTELRQTFPLGELHTFALTFEQLFKTDPCTFRIDLINNQGDCANIVRPGDTTYSADFTGVLKRAHGPDSSFTISPKEMSAIVAKLIELNEYFVNESGVTSPATSSEPRIDPQDRITANGIEKILLNRFNADVVKTLKFEVPLGDRELTVTVHTHNENITGVEVDEAVSTTALRDDIFPQDRVLKINVDLVEFDSALGFQIVEGEVTTPVDPEDGDLVRAKETVQDLLVALYPSIEELPLSDEFPPN